MEALLNRHVEILIKGWSKEERNSQKMLYEHYYGYAMSVCLRYSKSEEEAIEILNDGFMKVFTKINKYDRTKSFKGWLRKIMVNSALDHYRKNLKHYKKQNLDNVKNIQYSDNLLSNISYEEIIEVIQKLSGAYRVVFNLYVIDGYTHEEIANILNISVGTSKSNLARARANLKSMLEKIDKDEYAKYIR